MDPKARAARARSVLNDEILTLAMQETLAGFNKAMLAAKTAEERERHWHEYHALDRAWTKLKKWGQEAQ